MDSDEYPVYRLCGVIFPFFFEIEDYESAWAGGQIRDELPKIRGYLSHLLEPTLSTLFKPLLRNMSVIVENEIGTQKKDGTLTGCYRSIRDNESDFSVMLTNYPTIDYDKVFPHQIMMEYSLKIMSGYHSEAKANVSFNDFILTSVKSFDSQTWFSVMVLFFAFFGLWMTKRALFQNNEGDLRKTVAETLWDTLLLFISQESTDYYNFLDRLLSILMTLSFFLLTTIYFGLMSTDLVSVTKPTVINSYQDIMNQPNITPVFVAMMPDTQEFEDAYVDNDDSIQARFWAKYKSKKEMADPNADPRKLLDMMQEGANMKRVLIMNGIYIDEIRRGICKIKTGFNVYENVYTWISRDPAARMHEAAYIMRNGMKQTPQLKAFKRKMRSMFETGIVHSLIDAVTRDGLQSTDQFSLPSAPHSQVERCVSDQLVYANAFVDTVVLQNFQFLLALPVVMLPASVIVLLIEVYCHRNVQVAI